MPPQLIVEAKKKKQKRAARIHGQRQVDGSSMTGRSPLLFRPDLRFEIAEEVTNMTQINSLI